MKLEKFVEQTVSEIAAGVETAADKVLDRGVRILTSGGKPDSVEFDVAVTVQEGDRAEGGAGIFVAITGAGIKATADQTTTIVNRIRFSVPLIYEPKGHGRSSVH